MKFKKSIVLLVLSQLSLFSATYDVSTTSELRQALEKSAVLDENITIILDKNTYNVKDDNMGTFIYKSNTNENKKVLTIECRSKNKNECILDGNNENRVLYVDGYLNVVLKNLTIKNGKVTAQRGGGVFVDGSLTATNVDFLNNYLNGSDDTANGGALYAESVDIDNCYFENNVAYKNNRGKGGAIYTSFGIIKNSIFKNNTAEGIYSGSGMGGAIYARGSIVIINNKFFNNKAICSFNTDSLEYSECGNGGALYLYDRYGESLIIDNLFIENESKNFGSAIVSNSPLINNTIIGNKGGVSVAAKNTKLINNLFYNNSKDLLVKKGSINLYNNIIDISKVDGIENIYKLNNIQSSQGVLFDNKSYVLYSNSLGIDSGLNPTSETFKKLFSDSTYNTILGYLKKDYYGINRIINDKIDIGASEYDPNSPVNKNKPKIDIKISGDQKVYSNMTINLDINSSNPISELYIDKGEGYESVATTQKSFTVKFDLAGDHTIKVKAVDNQGNETEFSKNITVYNLTTQEAIEYGKKLCKDDPQSCGITQLGNILENPKLTDTTSGWKLLGANRSLTPSEIFSKNPQASILWLYRDGEWKAKGASSDIDSMISSSGTISLINSIENGDGFWMQVKQ